MTKLEDLLSEAKPKLEVDRSFKKELFTRLMNETKPRINLNFMNKFKLMLPAAALAVIAVAIVVTVPLAQKNAKLTVNGNQEITHIKANAFGQLNTLTLAAAGGRGGDMTAGLGGGNASLAADLPAPTQGVGISEKSMIWYPTNYKYVYKGEEFTVENDQMEVYERIKGFGSSVNLGSLLERFDVGLVDIGRFSNASIDYITASENRDSGYMLSLDLKQGTLYIGQNYERWPMPDYTTPISINQLPSNESAIAIANQFLSDYGISRENFGEPFVQDLWRMDYERSSDKASYYVPDTLTVMYPMKISGNEIYDESGNKTGMAVYINARINQVMSVGEITGQRYNASEYATEKDTKRLINIAETGGFRNYLPYAMPAMEGETEIKTEEVELGNPKIAYIRMWQYTNNQSKEMFIPSLVFPIINKPDYLYMQNLTVPLIKDILDAQQNGGDGGGGVVPPIKIMQ
jgi:hypothetical protein